MSHGVLIVDDCDLSLNLAGQQWHSSGYATIADDKILFGDAARQQWRLLPLVSFNQYWNQLGMQPLAKLNSRNPAASQFRHYGDFAYYQLLDLQQRANSDGSVIMVVPGSFDRQQLALLLGIAQQCPLKPIGLVDNALLALAQQTTPGQYLYVDIQMQQCLLTQVTISPELTDQEVQQNHLLVGQSDIVAGTGLHHLYQFWAKYLASEFIAQCRFDPLHHGKTEQQLYDLLPGILASDDDDIQLTLEDKQIKLTRLSLMRHSMSLFEPVIKAMQHFGQLDGVYISAKVNHILTLKQQLIATQTKPNLRVVEPAEIVQNCLRYVDQIAVSNGQQLRYVCDIVTAGAKGEKGEKGEKSTDSVDGVDRVDNVVAQPIKPTNGLAASSPTHLRYQHQAYSLNQPIYLQFGPTLMMSAGHSATLAVDLMIRQEGQQVIAHVQGSAKIKHNNQLISGKVVLMSGDCLTFNLADQHTATRVTPAHVNSASETVLQLIKVLEDGHW